MASPQVAGIVATLLQARPHYTQQQVLDWLIENAANNRLDDPTTGTPATDYTNYYALQGAPNRYLQTPFTSGFPYRFTGGISFSS